ncbi:MAG: MarR family transcriptional regulator [Candidatus Dormibacteria bacterium]|jgi:DNA-binding MarR family transcriptional regulator|nr:transcriptional regulator [Chloroflexota bacterium]
MTILLTPPPPRTPTSEDLALANRLRPLLLHLARHLRRVVKGSALTGGQVEILSLISRRPGVGINELASREGISAPSMSNAVDKLEAAGLVTRARGIAGDRRRVDIAVTPEGTRALRSARNSRTAWLAEQLGRLSPDQVAALEAAVEPLTALVEGDAPR